jgi:hypothetical protein
VTYDSELTDESREGNRLVSLPLLVLFVSVVLLSKEIESMVRRRDGQRIEGEAYLGNVINGDDVLVGMLIRLVDDGLDGGSIVLTWHCGWCCRCCW